MNALEALREARDRYAKLPPSSETVAVLSGIEHAAALLRADEGVIASAGMPVSRAAQMAAAQRRPRPRPGQDTGASAVTVVASSGSSSVPAGTVLTSRDELGTLTAEILEQLIADPWGGHDPRRRLVASARWADSYPEERRLTQDPALSTRRMSAITSPEAVTAAGGICLPVNVDYSVPTWGVQDRPLRDGLPAFQADRGGLRFVSPPDLGTPDLQGTAAGLGEATTVWTEATDASPGLNTKPVFQVVCGSEQLVYVDAIPTRVGFGNMQGRFAPEQVAANTDLALSVAAREAELELLTLMYDASKQIPADTYLGATRDLLASADILSKMYRYSHRMPSDGALTAVFPDWAKGVIRADMARELAHDNDGRDVLAITDDQIEAWFAIRGINVIWTLDGLKAGTYGTGGVPITNQFFPVATASTELVWPGQTGDGAFMLSWLLYAEGSYQFLDGGRLDIGVVRDSTLDATNSYEMFVESFESAAFRGIEAYQVQSTILPSGASAGTIAASLYEQ